MKYPSLNGLRAISIILVIIHHLSNKYKILHWLEDYGWLYPALNFIQDGHLGVTIFFIISGFLITSLLINEEILSGKVSVKNFYIRRTLRIFPAYYTLLFVYFLLQLAGIIEISNSSWLTAITYTKYLNWDADWVTAHAWSLSIEEQFYLVWPLIFIVGKKVRIITLTLLVLLPLTLRLFGYYNESFHFDEFHLFTNIDSIAIGCFMAIFKEKLIHLFLKKRTSWYAFAAFIILLSLYIIPWVAKQNGLGFFFIIFGETHGTLANALIAFIILYSVFYNKSVFFKLLNTRLMIFIGTVSYSLYLWQQIFLMKKDFWFNVYPLNVFCLIAAALLSYYLIEKPFLKLKEKYSRLKS